MMWKKTVRKYCYLLRYSFLKMKYQKKRYILYIISFYVGLLLPAFCIANVSSVEQVIYYSIFEGIENIEEIDWISKKFDLLCLPDTQKYSVKASVEEDFSEWNHKYVTINGIDEDYFYPLPRIEGRYFRPNEFAEGKMVCLAGRTLADEYSFQTGDCISIRGRSVEVVGILNHKKFDNLIIPYQTMEKIYQQEEDIQFTGLFLKKDHVGSDVMNQIQEKDENAELLWSIDGEELCRNALATQNQWRGIRYMLAVIAGLFFLLNETIVIRGKLEKEQKSIGISMALGASEREVKWGVFCEVLLLVFVSDILVLSTISPLAELVSLDSEILVDGRMITVFVAGSFLMCEIMTYIVTGRLKKQTISGMIKTGDL